jgi:DNA-binding NarL/FixJ family response regulator
MRIILVGTRAGRARLRSGLDQAGIEIVAEFDTIMGAHAADITADAVVLARDEERGNRRERDAGDESIHEPLTPREIEVLELLAEGLPNKSIARRLGISDQTVKVHVASVCGKLGAANRTGAVRRALRRGLVSL